MSKKKLLIFGDSFSLGYELEDRNNCFASLVATHFNLDCENHSVTGSSNQRIVSTLLMTDLKNVSIVLIGWSHFDRILTSDEKGTWDLWPGGERKTCVQEASWRKTLVSYLTAHHDDIFLYKQYLDFVILTQQYLKSKNIPFIMLDAFNISNIRFNKQFKCLVDKIDKETFLGWPNESMQNWTAGLPIGPELHFLEEGHRKVADKLITHCEEKCLIKY